MVSSSLQDNFDDRTKAFATTKSYFTSLYEDGEITDNQYKYLVQYAASVLLAEEINRFVEEPLEEYVIDFIENDLYKTLISNNIPQRISEEYSLSASFSK